MDSTTNYNPQKEETNLKKTLVFLHYFGGSAQSWLGIIAQLENDFNCIALNLPGFGGEPALPEPSIAGYTFFIRQKLDALNIESYVLIGHSMSGKFAVDVATNDPNFAVEQLILVAPSPPTVEHISDEELQRMLHHPDRKEAEITFKKITLKPLTEEQHELVIKNDLETDNKTWNWWLTEGVHHSIADDAANLFLPITVLASEDDPAVGFDSILKETMPHLPDAKLITTTGIGHLSPMEAPGWLAKQIRLTLYQQK